MSLSPPAGRTADVVIDNCYLWLDGIVVSLVITD